jgi:hypothetical protein
LGQISYPYSQTHSFDVKSSLARRILLKVKIDRVIKFQYLNLAIFPKMVIKGLANIQQIVVNSWYTGSGTPILAARFARPVHFGCQIA